MEKKKEMVGENDESKRDTKKFGTTMFGFRIERNIYNSLITISLDQ